MAKNLFNHHDKPSDQVFEDLRRHLESSSIVSSKQHVMTERFALDFREHFIECIRHIGLNDNQSNWTYITAFAIQRTATQLGILCDFETRGRFDAVITRPWLQTKEDPGTILFAEWEAKPETVFNKGSELDKLWKGSSREKICDAFLLTYVNQDNFSDFVQRVVQKWQSGTSRRKRKPTLYLTVILFQAERSYRHFKLMRTIEIKSSEAILWHDMPLIPFEELGAYYEQMLKK